MVVPPQTPLLVAASRTPDIQAVHPILDELTASGAASRWWPTMYEPETAAFGGPTAIPLVHDLFCADSRGVLDYLRHPQPGLGGRELSRLLLGTFLHAAGLDWFERGDVFARVAQFRPADHADDERFATLTAHVGGLLAVAPDTDHLVRPRRTGGVCGTLARRVHGKRPQPVRRRHGRHAPPRPTSHREPHRDLSLEPIRATRNHPGRARMRRPRSVPPSERTVDHLTLSPTIRGAVRRFPLLGRPRPACPALTDRVAEVVEAADAATQQADNGMAEAAHALNKAALIASDSRNPWPRKLFGRKCRSSKWSCHPVQIP
jgi:hypothetical protein